MGYPRIAELESQYLLDAQLERKYGSERADYVIRTSQHRLVRRRTLWPSTDGQELVAGL